MPDADLSPIPAAEPMRNHAFDQDEVDDVLAALRAMYQRVSSPMIRECLEAARFDIAYLAAATAERTEADRTVSEEAVDDGLDDDLAEPEVLTDGA